MPNLEQAPKPILLTKRDQMDFRNSLGSALKELIGIHEKLTFAIQNLHLVVLEELLLEKNEAHTPQIIFQRCQQKIDDLKKNQQIDENEFDQLNELFNLIAYYINIKPISRLKFLSIFHQEIHTILLDIHNKKFKFQDKTDHEQEIAKALDHAQKKQAAIKDEHNNQPKFPPSTPVSQQNPSNGLQLFLVCFELLFGTIAVPLGLILYGPAAFSSSPAVVFFASFLASILMEGVSYYGNGRSFLSNFLLALLALPNMISTYFSRNSAESNENAPLLSSIETNSDAPNNTSYGSILNPLGQNSETQLPQLEEVVTVSETMSESSSPTNLSEKCPVDDEEPLQRTRKNDHQENLPPEKQINNQQLTTMEESAKSHTDTISVTLGN